MALFLSARFTEAFELLNLSDTNPQIPIGYFPELAQPNSPFFKGDHELINLSGFSFVEFMTFRQ